jgi:hypothetical protein
MSAIATALPFGSDGYECFVTKGACRKCGQIAYRKRKCRRCHRKYCSTCEPQSMQKYGKGIEEECCVGCEPFLVVASEPIFELEPESEEIALPSPLCPVRPIFVPLSAIAGSAHDDNDDCCKESPPNSTTTFSTDSDSEQATPPRKLLQPPPVIRFCPEPACQDRLYPDGTCRSCSYHHSFFPRTPPPPNRCTTLDDPWSLQPPLTPDAGCCTACQLYSTGKTPCFTCGTKYCHETRCQLYRYSDGTCVKCRTQPRPIRIPTVPVETGCCANCLQYATGKVPCETCGTKYCQEGACQAFLFSNGTCARCHGNCI